MNLVSPDPDKHFHTWVLSHVDWIERKSVWVCICGSVKHSELKKEAKQ